MSQCSNLVERRSGGGISTGAGERSGMYRAACGQPTAAGSVWCQKCLNLGERQRARMHHTWHARQSQWGLSMEEAIERCPWAKSGRCGYAANREVAK